MHPELKDVLGVNRINAVNHMGYLSDDAAQASARLEEQGIPLFLFCRVGGNTFYWHDACKALGHNIEIIQNRPIIEKFHRVIGEKAEVWDGADPLKRKLPDEIHSELGHFMIGN